ncbi:MAG: ScyD/ScyE family protein [Chloroflexia bacterium]|nr:ScyD/ScyE family protein [Chloroflexia bacterium]
MTHHQSRLFSRIAIVIGFVLLAPAVAARQGTPVATSSGITLEASGLDDPRGFTWAADGTLYVAMADVIADGSADGATPTAFGSGTTGGLNGSVAWIESGCPVTYQGELPSSGGSGGVDLGPSDLAFLNGQLYVLDDGGGESHGNPLTPSGVYAIDGGGSARLVADISTWIGANPVTNPPASIDPDGDPFAMVGGNGALWVTEFNSGQLLKVDADGTITRIVDFSAGNRVPTGLAAAADGSLYVALLEGGSFASGAASIVNVTQDGVESEVWTGLTAVTAVAVGPDSTLYALEMGSGGADDMTSVERNSGQVVRQTDVASSSPVAVGFDVPIAMAFGPDLGLYVSSPAFSLDTLAGSIVRLNTSQGQVMTVGSDLLATSPCIDQTTPTPASSPEASPSSGGSTLDAATGPAVDIQNFAFGPATLTVSVGDTVTWTNNDTVPHTATASGGAFDSGTISPGDTFTFTFTEAGSFDYICNFHPNMMATIVVQ